MKSLKTTDKSFMQLDLTPFMPGGFMHHWLEFVKLNHPDVATHNLTAVKLAGAMLLSNIAKIYINTYRQPPASWFLILVGKPRCGKGSIISCVRKVAATMRAAGVHIYTTGESTPEALLPYLNEKHNVIQCWEEVGGMLRRIGRGKKIVEYYQGLDKILNNAYYASQIVHLRKDEKKYVEVEERSYFLSFIWDCTPDEYGELQRVLGGETGFSRRVLPVRMSDVELPYFSDFKYDPRSVEHLQAMVEIAKMLDEQCFYVDVDLGFLEDKLRKLDCDRLTKSCIADYTRKLVAACLVDWMIRPGIVATKNSEGYEVMKVMKEIYGLHLSTLPSHNLTLPYITKHNLITLKSDKNSIIPQVILTSYNLITSLLTRFQVLADEEVARYSEKTREYLDKKPCITKKEWVLKVLCGLPSRVYKPLMETLEDIGVIRVVRRKRGTYILDPNAKICGNCVLFDSSLCHNVSPGMPACKDFKRLEEG